MGPKRTAKLTWEIMTTSESIHLSVMPSEILDAVFSINSRIVADGTFGGGGHSRLIVDRLPTDGRIIAIDRDPDVSTRYEADPIDPRIELFVGSYEQIDHAMRASEIEFVDAMILDLGLSSDQLADRDRGFSYTADGPLDLRFDNDNGPTAAEWLSRHSEKEIADAIYQFGEERFSRRIAKQIVLAARSKSPVQTVDQLVDICRRCVPRSKNHDIHPATRTFQALRIVINDELGHLTRTLAKSPQWLRPGGVMAIISFHSLEDRIVKNAFREDDRWTIVTKKPLRPSDQEVAENPRSRSAKLRVATRACDP